VSPAAAAALIGDGLNSSAKRPEAGINIPYFNHQLLLLLLLLVLLPRHTVPARHA
jgi:hypothetical protein